MNRDIAHLPAYRTKNPSLGTAVLTVEIPVQQETQQLVVVALTKLDAEETSDMQCKTQTMFSSLPGMAEYSNSSDVVVDDDDDDDDDE